MPGFVRGAILHRGKHMDQSGMFPTGFENLRNPIFLAKRVKLADELDLDSMVGGEGLGMIVNLIPQRHSPVGKIENHDSFGVQVVCGGFCITDVWKRTIEDHPVKTRNNAYDILSVSVEKVHDEFLCRK